MGHGRLLRGVKEKNAGALLLSRFYSFTFILVSKFTSLQRHPNLPFSYSHSRRRHFTTLVSHFASTEDCQERSNCSAEVDGEGWPVSHVSL